MQDKLYKWINSLMTSKNQSGFSLTEISVALGLISIVGLGAISLYGQISTGYQQAYIREDFSSLKVLVESSLGNEATCRSDMNLVGQVADLKSVRNSVPASQVPIVFNRPVKEVKANWKEGSVINDRLLIKKMRINKALKVREDSQGNLYYMANLLISAVGKSDHLGRIRSHNVPLMIKTDEENKVSSCYAEQSKSAICEMVGLDYNIKEGDCQQYSGGTDPGGGGADGNNDDTVADPAGVGGGSPPSHNDRIYGKNYEGEGVMGEWQEGALFSVGSSGQAACQNNEILLGCGMRKASLTNLTTMVRDQAPDDGFIGGLNYKALPGYEPQPLECINKNPGDFISDAEYNACLARSNYLVTNNIVLTVYCRPTGKTCFCRTGNPYGVSTPGDSYKTGAFCTKNQ